MTPKQSQLILKSHQNNEEAINKWLDVIIEKVIFFYNSDAMKASAHFLYKTLDNQFVVKSFNEFLPTDKGYESLIMQNYIQGSPVIACSICLPVSQYLEDGDFITNGMVISIETPLKSTRQVWTEITDPKSNDKSLEYNKQMTIQAKFPEEIEKFLHIIHYQNNTN